MFDVSRRNQQATQMIPDASQIHCQIEDLEILFFFFQHAMGHTVACTDTLPLFARSIAGSCGRNEFHLCALS